MTKLHGFDLVLERYVDELSSTAKLWKHTVTGAELLSFTNDDENKVFGVSFRTPPEDSTGVAHILEHSVLNGSEKYPVKEPFVELLKCSLQTFLNAFTYPDKTCYPVASTNLQDFYNLIDVYLDAAFFPRISESIFKQEGWHYEVEGEDNTLSYKGVVFNEMKGVYSSPDSMLSELSQQSVFPDITYGLDSGGNPEVIPELTYEQFHNFHETFYHPSNGRFFFWGDDPEEGRLAVLGNLLDRFGPLAVESDVPLQKTFQAPVRVERGYPAGEGDSRSMFTINWLLPETTEATLNFAFQMLDHILIGMPASPLRKALIESGLGEDMAGVGLENELRQMYFSTGLKGIDPARIPEAEALIFDTLYELATNGIDPACIEAAVNSVEFSLRENNTGRFPVGLAVMVRSLTTWLYDADPLALLAFEEPLSVIKESLAEGERLFEDLIQAFLLGNPHRATVSLMPDAELAKLRNEREQERLKAVRAGLSERDIQTIRTEAEALKTVQETPDDPEILARIPRLTIGDIPRDNTTIPIEEQQRSELPVLFHDIDTKGIIYADLAFDLSGVSGAMMPLVPLLGRALTEMGTSKRDFVELGMRIAAKTGGLEADMFTGTTLADKKPLAKLMLHGKATVDKAEDLYDLMREVLLEGELDDKERFRSILLEEKARAEHRMIPSGHLVVISRLRAGFSPSGWVDEMTDGIGYLFALRELAQRVENDWEGVLADLRAVRDCIVRRDGALLNITQDASSWAETSRFAETMLASLPAVACDAQVWTVASLPDAEAFAIPAQVNYVGKAANLYDLGYTFHGSANVIFKHLRMGWLWDKVRVQGGAYGAFCAFDRLSGVLSQVSYRDPNLAATLDVYDRSAAYLRTADLSSDELEKAIIGAIGDFDAYQLPDARGMASFGRYLTGLSDDIRQQTRDEILSTTLEDFRRFAEVMAEAAAVGRIAVLGGAGVREEAEQRGWVLQNLL